MLFFYRQTGHKKKLNTFISFPEQLDMGPFFEGKHSTESLAPSTLCFTTSAFWLPICFLFFAFCFWVEL